MKNRLFFFFLIGLSTCSFAQSDDKLVFQYNGRVNPSVNNERLSQATFMGNIMPDFWDFLVLPFRERVELGLLRSYFPETSYSDIVDVLGVEVTVTTGGEEKTITGGSEKITPEQSILLSGADLGSTIIIRFIFRHKQTDNSDSTTEKKIAYYSVTVVPHQEAYFTEGYEAFSSYIQKEIIDKAPVDALKNNLFPDAVSFVVNEAGAVENVTIQRRNKAVEMDEMIRRVFLNMPDWSPAQDHTGKKLKQSFQIPLASPLMGC